MQKQQKLHKRRDKPLYKGIADDLRTAIAADHYGFGNRLPTEADIQETYGVSRHTVRQAFQDLVAEGLVYRVAGRGTFVSGLSQRWQYLRSIGTIEELMSWTETDMELVQPMKKIRDPEASARLELDSGEVAIMVVRRRYEGKPFVLTQVILPPELAEIVETQTWPTKNYGTIIGVVEERTSRDVVGISQDIVAVAAPNEVANALECEVGEPLMKIERLYVDSEGTPVELAIAHQDPRRYPYHLEFRRRGR